MEWNLGVEPYSGILELSFGMDFGMKSDFEFFAVPPFFIIFTVYKGNIKLGNLESFCSTCIILTPPHDSTP